MKFRKWLRVLPVDLVIGFALFLFFTTLKLCDVIAWPWCVVASPIWMAPVAGIFVFILVRF